MLEVFRSGGVMMWPMLLVAAGVLVLAARVAVPRWAASASREEIDLRLQSILFWGGMGAVLGLLGTAVGIVQMAEVIERFGGVSMATLAGGIAVALVTTIFGLLIFLLSLVFWFALRLRFA